MESAGDKNWLSIYKCSFASVSPEIGASEINMVLLSNIRYIVFQKIHSVSKDAFGLLMLQSILYAVQLDMLCFMM